MPRLPFLRARRHPRLRPGPPPGPAAITAAALLVAGLPAAAPAAPAAAVAVQPSPNRADAQPPTAGAIPQILAAAAEPAYTRRDRGLFVDVLGLDEAQAARVDELLAAYDAAFTARLDAFRAAMREARPDRAGSTERYRAEQTAMRERMKTILEDARAEAAAASAAGDEATARRIIRAAEEEIDALREELGERLREFGPGAAEGRAIVDAMLARMQELAADFAADRERIGADLLEGVRAMLDEAQATRWPALERRLVLRTLSLGRLAGEQVHLARVLEETVPSSEVRALAAEPLARWEREVHAALILRNAELPGLEADLRALALAAAEDPDAARAMRSRAARRVQLHRAVRDATLAAATAIADALPPGPAADFTAAVQEAAFPSVARRTPFERLLAEARGLAGLAPSEDRGLADLADRYAEERAAADARLRQAIVEDEPRQLREAVLAPPTIGDPADVSPVSAAFRARRELDARYAEAVRSLLGEDRFAALRQSRLWRR